MSIYYIASALACMCRKKRETKVYSIVAEREIQTHHTYTHTHTHTHTHIHMSTHILMYMYAQMCTHTHTTIPDGVIKVESFVHSGK